jgi:xylulokinase
MAYTAKPGSNGLIFFPYLLGERAPLWNDYARGMFVGMRMDMGRNELTRSVFEGTAFALKHVMETVKKEGAKAETLRICGGGAKSRVWNQIKAAVLNMPVYVLSPESGDVPVGDAMIAGHKAGVFGSLTETAEKIIKIQEIIEPNPEWVKIYDELYPYYVNMYQHLDNDLKNMQMTLENIYKNA